MSTAYVVVAFVIAFSPLAIGLGIAAWDDHCKRKAAQREFHLIAERDAASTALRQPYRFTGRAM